MMSYRFKRRSFLQGVGGAVGLKVLLRNLEAQAQGVKSPPRMLVTHWPVGIVRTGFAPTSGSTGGSITLKPFADAGLAADMTVFMGASMPQVSNGGGGHEAGTVKMMTGVNCPGTRGGLPEGDDAYAGGPSYDQIFLNKGVGLKSPMGKGYANSIADSRVDFLETSTQCLSYDYATRSVSQPAGTGMENIPLFPDLSPIQQYMKLFGMFVPQPGTGGATGGGTGGAGGGTPAVNAMLLKQLWTRKSCLDFALTELAQLRTLAPSSEWGKVDLHTKAIRDVESTLSNQIAMMHGGTGVGGNSGGGGGAITTCTTKPVMPPDVTGKTSGMMSMNNYGVGRDGANVEDAPIHAMVGAAHMQVLKAAFICDVIRVGTFQWSPGTNHVSFKDMFPNNPGIFMHHPVSHRIGTAETQAATLGDVAMFLRNCQIWYYTEHAKLLADWKNTLDGSGRSLLETVAVPFVTEVEATGHGHGGMAAMLFGGQALGFTHGAQGTLKNNIGDLRNFWATVGQAFGVTGAPLGTPIAGVWTRPPA